MESLFGSTLSEGKRNHLLEELYAELRAVAERLMAQQRPDSVLQPTALVHEFCAKVCAREGLVGDDPLELISLATVVMRNTLIDRARRRDRARRCPAEAQVEIDELALVYEARAGDIEGLDEALRKLSQFDPEMSKAVELHFFVGLPFEDVARLLRIPLRTFERRWKVTKAWLQREIE